MLRRKKFVDPNQQIPYPIYTSLHESASPRRKRWIIEILLAAGVVILIALGSVWLYNKHAGKVKQPTPSQRTTVQQSPQKNKSLTPSGTPAQTKATGTNNSSTVSQPSGS